MSTTRTLALSSLVFCACTLVVPSTTRASESALVFPDGVTHTPAWWHLALVQGRVSDRLLVWLEAQPRLALDLNPRLDRLLLRPALGVALTDELSVWAGVAWIPAWSSWLPDDVSAGELRFFEQLLYTTRFGPLTLQSRSRLEQRMSALTPPTTSDDVAHRARTLLRLALALDDDRTWSLVAWDEVFVHLGLAPRDTPLAFDQNRAFAGVSWRASSSMTLEAGLLNATVRTRDGTLAMTHGLYTFSVFTLP